MYIQRPAGAPAPRHTLSFPLEIKSVATDGRFAGYASVFGVVDTQRDVVLRGAFTGSIEGREGAIKLLWQHQPEEPIGTFTRMFEDARGLYVEGRLLLTVQRAREAHALMKAGALSGLSIGYTPVRYSLDHDTGVRYLESVELWEISLVTFPANAAANITVVKSHRPGEYQPPEVIAFSKAVERAIHTLRHPRA